MTRTTRFRGLTLLSIFGFVMILYAIKLYQLQIIDTKGNTNNMTTYTTITTVRAARGDILDRNGNLLVGNRASYDLVFNHYVAKSFENTNESLYLLVQKCDELQINFIDHFPITKEHPFEYTLDGQSTAWQNYFHAYMQDFGLDPDITAPLLFNTLRTRYKIPAEWPDNMARAIIGIRYEFDLRGVSNLPTYTFIQDVSSETLAAILELNTPGLMVESSTVREYHTAYAAHILGYMGSMNAGDWDKYKESGYSMDAQIGRAGMEQAFEQYLHGIDGTRVDVVSKNGTTIQSYYVPGKEPIPGNNVETTIDINLQRVAEDVLAETMQHITDPETNPYVGENTGLDAQGAAVVVMKVKTGEILACASYPTYHLATLTEDWKEINSNPLNPLFNRAFGAYYAPGSAFKMCTLVAAMENTDSTGKRILSYGDTIRDMGVFTEYGPGFAPKCLLYKSVPGATHGEIDATDALKVSCNYFFYILGAKMTWQQVDNTAKGFGLGEPTGIELEEKIGWRSNPESKLATYQSGADATYSAGDRVLAAIGQAENRYTPLQLCVYACALANQGLRYKATFLKRVASFDYRTLLYEGTPEIASKLDISDLTYKSYVEGMRKVITGVGGTASKYFGGAQDQDSFPVAVCAKTGTAEHSSGGSDHGSFICFAPMDDPEIAVAVYGEKVAHGSSLAPVAEAIIRSYIEQITEKDVVIYENNVS